jgi:tryptophan synthase alpha chain
MSRITEKFTELKAIRRKGLIVYLSGGYPDYETTLQAVRAAEAAGADIIEIGIPFSDPMADGPVIQKAATQALAAGATTEKTLELIKQIRKTSAIPLAVMTYINTILHYGVAQFVRDFAQAGIDGIIVPDLPAEESVLLEQPCVQAGLDLIHFVAPTTTGDRIQLVCQKASGFVYCISNTGVTGVRQVDYRAIAQAIAEVRKATTVPLAIGFGIGTGEAAREASQYADAVIVGSAIVTALGQAGVAGVRTLTQSIRRGLDERAEEDERHENPFVASRIL